MKTSNKPRDVTRELALCKLSGALVGEAVVLNRGNSDATVRRDWIGRAVRFHSEMIDFLAFQPASPTDEFMMGTANEFKKLIDMCRRRWEF